MTIAARAEAIFAQHRQQNYARIDRLFAGLLVLEWLGAVVAAHVVAPRTWIGSSSMIHLHVWAAVFLGGTIACFPALLGVLRPGRTTTRHTIAVAQMLMSALLIDVTGGRIETHFHVFGSLAFLAFYRDWQVFGPATFVVAADHLLRGIYWPESVYGVSAAPWRWLEHSWWVLFEDVFLVNSCLQSVREMRGIASQQAQLEQSKETTAQTVRDRTVELRASEEVFRSLSAASPIGIFRTDATGALLYCNTRWTETVGRSHADVLHADWASDVDPEDAGVLAQVREAMAQGTDETTAELRVRRPDGERRWVHVSSKPVLSDAGVVLGHVGTLQDISERKRAELDRAAEARTAAALAHVGRELISSLETPVLLERVCHLTASVLGGDYSNTWLRDPEHETYRVIAGHGLEPDQWEALQTLRVHGDALPHLVAALTVGETVVLDPDHVPDAILRTVLVRHGAKAAACIPLLRGDGLVGLQVIGYRSAPDAFTSERAAIARGIAQLASMALANARLVEETTEASRLKSEFLSTMSHELRTPLNVILGYTEMLGGADEEERASLLDRVRRTSLELLDMVTATLDLTRIAAGGDCAHLEAVVLGPLLTELELEFAALHRRPDVHVRWVDPGDVAVQTDARKLAAVLRNLVGNAVKFTRAGTVTIETRVAEGRCVIDVVDTGVGIAPESVPYIFDMFRQADSSDSRSYGGVGLGLYVVKTLTAQIGATIDVETAVGSGSRFRVTLPMAASTAEHDPAAGDEIARCAAVPRTAA
jgi:PAS domain S-box-containing protein